MQSTTADQAGPKRPYSHRRCA